MRIPPLLWIIGIYLLLAISYSWMMGPFEGPDEPEHFAYISWLIDEQTLPPQGDGAWETPLHQEASQPPLYYLVASLFVRFIPLHNPPATFRPNPYYFALPTHYTIDDNENTHLRHSSDTQPLTGGWLALYIARSVSIAFGLLLLVATYQLTQEVEPQLAVWVTLLVATIPQLLFITGVVSNDVPASALSTLTLWLLLRALCRQPTVPQFFLIGIFYGLAILTKISTAALALPLGIAILSLWRKKSKTKLLQLGLALTLGATLIAGWWFGHNLLLYGSPLGLETHDNAPWAINPAIGRGDPLAQWIDVFQSFWLAFVGGGLRLPSWAYTILACVCLVAIGGWLLGRRPNQTHQPPTITWIILLATIVAIGLALEIWMWRVLAHHGRLMFPAIAPIAILLVTGWQRIHPRLMQGLVSGVALLALSIPFWLLPAAFLPPRPMPEMASASYQWRFGELAQLHSLTLDRPSAKAGELLTVQLCWQTLQKADRDYVLFVQLVGPENQVVAYRHTHPGLGKYPTSNWQAGIIFCDPIRLEIPTQLPQTLLYQVEVGWFDPTTNQRLPAFAADQPLGATFAATVRLEKQNQERVMEMPASADPLFLIDHSLPNQTPIIWQTGKSYPFRLTWGVAQPVEVDYTLFVHLRNEQGENIAQADGPPLNGWYATSYWTEAEQVMDNRLFSLPTNLSPGNYNLVVGWYEPISGQRLGTEWTLATVEVVP